MSNYYDNAVDEQLWAQIDGLQSRIDYLNQEIKYWEEDEAFEICQHLVRIRTMLTNSIEKKLLELIDE